MDKNKSIKSYPNTSNFNCLEIPRKYWEGLKNPRSIISAIMYCTQHKILFPKWLQDEIEKAFIEATFDNRGKFLLGGAFSGYTEKKQTNNVNQMILSSIYAEALDAGLKEKDALELTCYEFFYNYPNRKKNEKDSEYDQNTIKKYYKTHSSFDRNGISCLLLNYFVQKKISRTDIGQVVCSGNEEWLYKIITKRLDFYKSAEIHGMDDQELIEFVYNKTESFLKETVPESVQFIFKIANF